MTDNHPITPPPELVDQWVQATESNDCIGAFPTNFEKRICTAAAQWGADMELEACIEWLKEMELVGEGDVSFLRDDRRPKPPSLKEQALKALDDISIASFEQDAANIIRQALETLND
jgi:hypothetical protein